MVFNNRLSEAIRNNNIETVKQYFEYQDKIAVYAALNHKIDIVKLTINKNNINNILAAATFVGDLDIINLAIKEGANDFERMANIAVYRGDLRTLELAVKFGANNFCDMTKIAAYKGYKDIVLFGVNNGARNMKEIAKVAAYKNHYDILDYAIDHGAYHFYYDFRRMLLKSGIIKNN